MRYIHLTFICLLLALYSKAQCINGTQNPGVAIVDTNYTVLNWCMQPGQYGSFFIQSSGTYLIKGNVITDFITVRSNTANGTVVTFLPVNNVVTLNPGLYYYHLNSNSSCGTTTGTCRTIAIKEITSAPSCTELSPADQTSISVCGSPALSWLPVQSAQSYRVYFGTSSNPPAVTSTTGTTYTPPSLSPNTTYYWKIVPGNIYGDASGCGAQSFSTTSSCQCFPNFSNGSCSSISNWSMVAFGIAYYGTCTTAPGYVNETATSGFVFPGTTYTCSVPPLGGSWSLSIFLDLNNNGSFDDSGERIYSSSITTDVSGNVTIPSNASSGWHNIRCVYNFNGTSITSCASNTSVGFTRDFSLYVSPASVSASGPLTFCSPGSVTLTASGGSSYLWSDGSTGSSITKSTNGVYSLMIDGHQYPTTFTITANAYSVNAIAQNYQTFGNTFNNSGTYFLNTNQNVQFGSVWNTTPFSLQNDFDFTFNISQSSTSEGMAFILNSAVNPLLSNIVLANLGYYNGVNYNNSLAVELDVLNSGPSFNDASSSHIAITKNASTVPLISATNITSPASLGNSTTRPLRITWNSTSKVLSVSLDNIFRTAYSGDIVSTIFQNNPIVYFGFTGSGTNATQSVTPVSLTSTSTALPVITGTSAICSGQSTTLGVNLTATTTGTTYLWSNNATTPTISVNTTTSFTVKVAGSNGCLSPASNPFSVTVNPFPVITNTSGTSSCYTSPVTLTSSLTSNNIWNTGATTQSIVVDSSATYSLTNNGCQSNSYPLSYTQPIPAPNTGLLTFTCPGIVQLNASGLSPCDKGLNLSSDLQVFYLTQNQTNFTFETWIKTTSTNAGIFCGYNFGGGYNRILYINNGVLSTGLANQSTWSSGINISDNQWHHVAWVVQSGVGQKIYIDGMLSASTITPDNASLTTDIIYMGLLYLNGTPFLNGLLDETRFWNVARTSQDIKNNMRLDSPFPNTGLIYNNNYNTGGTAAGITYLGGTVPVSSFTYYTFTWSGPFAPAPTTSVTTFTTAPVNTNSNYSVVASLGSCSGNAASYSVNLQTPISFLSCPSDITVDNDTGQCGAVVNYTDSLSGTNINFIHEFYSPTSITGVVSGTGSGSMFPIGTTAAVIIAFNSCYGDTCSFNITVNDAEPAHIVSDLHQCNDSVVTAFPGAVDNCGVQNVSYSVSLPHTFPPGTTNVSADITDGNGVTTTAYFNVSIDEPQQVGTIASTETMICDGDPSEVFTVSGNSTEDNWQVSFDPFDTWQDVGTLSVLYPGPPSPGFNSDIKVRAVISNSCNSDSSNEITIHVHDCGNDSMTVKAFIQGFYTGGGFMRAVVDPIGNPTICDTAMISFVDSVYGEVFMTDTVLLHTDGTMKILYPKGMSSHQWNMFITHRSALQTWANIPFVMSAGSLYDFTNAASKAYGNNLADLGDGNFGLYSGDVSYAPYNYFQDGIIDDYDFDFIEQAAINFETGYILADITGDGIVDASDYSLIENNLVMGLVVMRP